MGNQNSTSVRQEIVNEINQVIRNTNTTINNITNNTLNKAVNNISTNAAASVNISTSGGNNFIIKGGTLSNATVDQKATALAESTAIVNILTDNSAMAGFTNQILADLNNAVKNDNDVSSQLQTIQKLGESTTNAGGPEGMLQSIGDFITKTFSIGNTSRKDVVAAVKNKFNLNINNETTVVNSITNTVSKIVTNNMNQLLQSKCNMNTSAINNIKGKNVTIEDTTVIQEVNVTAFNKCLIDLNFGNKITNTLLTGSETTNLVFTDNKNTVKDASKTIQENNTTVKNESAIMKTFDTLVNGLLQPGTFALIIVACILLAGVAFIAYSEKRKVRNFSDISELSD